MKNDIIRKLTSLTLMTIMVAGGLTFAIPSALPQAAAAPGTDGTLTVSSTEFGGQQIIEIRINDPDYQKLFQRTWTAQRYDNGRECADDSGRDRNLVCIRC